MGKFEQLVEGHATHAQHRGLCTHTVGKLISMQQPKGKGWAPVTPHPPVRGVSCISAIAPLAGEPAGVSPIVMCISSGQKSNYRPHLQPCLLEDVGPLMVLLSNQVLLINYWKR
jgi:hypothetical protein